MPTSRLVRSLIVATGVCAVVGAGPDGRVSGQQAAPPAAPAQGQPAQGQPVQGQPQQGQSEVTFRTDANYVLTDVFVTADGKPVTDLTQADFEVREDGVVQTVRSFEAVRHDTQPAVVARRDPSTVAESEAMIADPRRRVFVVFLDTFHVERSGSMVVREALTGFLKTALGPDDLVAFMTPHMSGRDISFTSSTSPLLRYLDENPVWGVADEMLGTETDPVERDLSTCFIGNDAAWGPLRSRLREQKTLDSMRGLVAYLDGLRESRKAVIAVTQGWRLFRENETRLTDGNNNNRVRGLDPVAVGPTSGGLGVDDRGRLGGVAKGTCDGAHFAGSFADSQRLFQDLIGEANRASTSFYTLDASGLRTETRPHPTTPLGAAVEARNRERVPYSTRLDSIRTLGESTNGMALVDSNDFSGSLRKAAADFNSYYLLGYTSTNGKADGKYRKIKVTVKRPGVQVRARDGYLARRVDDVPASTSTGAAPGASTPTAEQAQLTAALGRLAPARPGVPLVVSAAAGAVAGSTARTIRVTAELDPAVAATPEWADGGEVQAFVRNAKGETVTTGKAALAKGARTVEIDLPVVEGMAGDVKVQVRVTGTGPLARYTDTTNVALDALPAGWGAPRLSRRGPSTGIAWVPTADPRFRRQERLRVSVGVGAEAGAMTGTLLDRLGKPLNVPVKIDQAEPTALIAELTLAPLAAGDYVLALGGGPRRLLVPLRIVP
jgi:VWFA-related protein